jgi:hypothetical protein
MLAFKLPMNLYLAFMQEAHHEAPAREAERLNYDAQRLVEQGRGDGLPIEMEDGMAELGSNQPARGVFS